MSALDKDSTCTQIQQLSCPPFHVGYRVERSSQKGFGFVLVRSYQIYQREQFPDHGLLGVVLQQSVSRGGNHDRIKHHPHHPIVPLLLSPLPELPHKRRHFLDKLVGPQHANLDGARRQVGNQRIELGL